MFILFYLRVKPVMVAEHETSGLPRGLLQLAPWIFVLKTAVHLMQQMFFEVLNQQHLKL